MTAVRLYRPRRKRPPVAPPGVLDADRRIESLIGSGKLTGEPRELLAILERLLCQAAVSGVMTQHDKALAWRLSVWLLRRLDVATATGIAAVNALLDVDTATVRAVAKDMLRRDDQRRREAHASLKRRLQNAFEAGQRVAYREFMSLTAAYVPKRGA